MSQFHKYHALGNDYIVLDPAEAPTERELSPALIRVLCHRNFGIGSDGILLGPLEQLPAPVDSGDCKAGQECCLRIFNPDGSEAEKSGNGLRIFARYLRDSGRVGDEPFTVHTLGGPVRCHVLDEGRQVRVEMGSVSFSSRDIPVTGPQREVLEEEFVLAGTPLRYSAATVGNPHCVVLRERLSVAETRSLGPLLEVEPRFPNRTNVQFMQVLDRQNLRIEIWERGAGYTLASGSSASAAAAVAHRLGLCDERVTVHMQGGPLTIEVSPQYDIILTGPVTAVAHGTLAPEALTQKLPESPGGS